MQFDPDFVKYLKSDRWKAKRELIFLKTGKWCKACGVTRGPFNVHHLTYERLGRELISDLIVLCKPCHDILTKEWRTIGRRAGFTLREFTKIWINSRRLKNGRK